MNGTGLDDQPVRIVNRVVSVLTILLVVYSAVFSWQSWRRERSEQVQHLMNIMELVEKAVDTYLGQLENSLRGLSEDLSGVDEQSDLEHAFILVKRFKELHPELVNVTFIREDGRILLTAKTPPSPTLPSLAQEDSFIKFLGELQKGQPLSIGQPLVGLIGKEWIIPLRYAIRSKGGELVGIISANLPIGMLQGFWQDAPFTETAALGLMRDDGFLVSRYPVPGRLQMDEIYGKPRTGALIQHLRQEQFPVKGYVEGPSSLDGPDHLNAFRRLEHFPITLFIAMPMSAIRAGWWDKVKIPYMLSALLLAGAIFVSRMTMRRQRTREIEQWNAHEALRRSEERFRFIAETIRDVFWMSTPGVEKMLYVSPAYEEIWGRTRESLYAEPHSFIDVVHPDDRPLILSQVAEHAEGRWECRYRIVRPGGEVRWIHDRGFPVRDEHGNLRFMTGVASDITDGKKAEEELTLYMQKLQESNQALQEFASIASHDLQEPLRKVSAFGNRLGDMYGNSLGREGQNYLNRMLNATERMQALLTSLLDYSRVTTKGEPFRDVALAAIVREVLSDLEVRIEMTGGEVHVGELPTIEADPTQMRQLFQNLIGNALKFHKQGEKPVVRVSAHNENDHHIIRVEDNGIGFEEQYLDKIFAPFQRLHGRSSSYEGTGMGLAICKKIIERHGGSITAKSAPDVGSLFTMELPAKRAGA